MLLRLVAGDVISDLNHTHAQWDERVDDDEHAASCEQNTGADDMSEANTVRLVLGKIGDEWQEQRGQTTDD